MKKKKKHGANSTSISRGCSSHSLVLEETVVMICSRSEEEEENWVTFAIHAWVRTWAKR